jgi:hypothetical protein
MGSTGKFYKKHFADVAIEDDWFKYYGLYWELDFFCEKE